MPVVLIIFMVEMEQYEQGKELAFEPFISLKRTRESCQKISTAQYNIFHVRLMKIAVN
jgi:hypothetical protein